MSGITPVYVVSAVDSRDPRPRTDPQTHRITTLLRKMTEPIRVTTTLAHQVSGFVWNDWFKKAKIFPPWSAGWAPTVDTEILKEIPGSCLRTVMLFYIYKYILRASKILHRHDDIANVLNLFTLITLEWSWFRKKGIEEYNVCTQLSNSRFAQCVTTLYAIYIFSNHILSMPLKKWKSMRTPLRPNT